MVAFPRKWLGPLIAVAFLWPLLRPVWPDVFSDYRLFLVSTMIIAAIAVLGLNLLTGFNGQISLGHGAFFALGAIPGYMTAPHIADGFSRRTMLAVYFIGSVISTLTVYQLAHSPWAFMAATFMHGFFTQGQFVWFAIYPPELFPTAVRGSAISTILNVTRFISLLGPIFAGEYLLHLHGTRRDESEAQRFGLEEKVLVAVHPPLFPHVCVFIGPNARSRGAGPSKRLPRCVRSRDATGLR